MRVIKMMLVLISVFFFGCENQKSTDETELEIIRQTLFELAPNYPDLMPISIPFTESDELVDIRFDSAKVQKQIQIDSLGLEIWILDRLVVPDEFFLTKLKKYDDFEIISPNELMEKKINFNKIKMINGIKIISTNKMGELPINNIGFVQYSRMFFNDKMDKAMFAFSYFDRTCTGGFYKYVLVENIGGKWKLLKNNLL